jgi:Ricin-type beta-trefoil lectin domain
MRSIRRYTVAGLAAGLVAAGGFTAFTVLATSAKAENVTACEATSGSGESCSLDTTVTSPGQLVLIVTVNTGGAQSMISWSDTCTSASGASASESGSADSTTPQYTYPVVGVSNPTSCEVTAKVQVDLESITQEGLLSLDDNAGTSAAPTPTATATPSATASVHQARGYAGNCITDAGDSSAIRSKIEISPCSSTDTAQGWTYSGDELKIHSNLCVNAKGNGKSGSKLILWNCNGSANEIWIHKTDGEYVLKANGYKLCIDDPAFARKSGTQLAVYACNDGSNQRWSLP